MKGEKQRDFYRCFCRHECKDKSKRVDKERRCWFQSHQHINSRRTRIYEGNFCTEGCGSLSLCRMDVNGFTYSYKKDEFIYGDRYNGERWITTRNYCDLILEPAHFLRQHCQSGQTKAIIKSNIWPEVATELIQIAQQSDADAYCLGFKEDEHLELLITPLNELPLMIGREFKDKVAEGIFKNRLQHGRMNEQVA